MSPAITRTAGRALIGMVAVLAVLAACTGCDSLKDDTDPPNGISGMALFTDHATGCQYLGFGSGANGKALSPRIAADGHSHMGCREAKQ